MEERSDAGRIGSMILITPSILMLHLDHLLLLNPPRETQNHRASHFLHVFDLVDLVGT